MAAEYVVDRWPDADGPSAPVSRAKMLLRLGRFLLGQKVRMRDRIDGEPRSEWGSWGGWLPALQTLSRRMRQEEIGTRLWFQRDRDDAQLRVWKVAGPEPIEDLGAAPALEAIHAYLFGKWGDRIRSGGLWFCRFISGETIVSRHGYLRQKLGQILWKGAAEDIFVVTPNTMEFLYEVALDLVAQAKAGTLHARDIICGDKRWRAVNGFREEHYGGLYHRHIHVDVAGGEPCTPS